LKGAMLSLEGSLLVLDCCLPSQPPSSPQPARQCRPSEDKFPRSSPGGCCCWWVGSRVCKQGCPHDGTVALTAASAGIWHRFPQPSGLDHSGLGCRTIAAQRLSLCTSLLEGCTLRKKHGEEGWWAMPKGVALFSHFHSDGNSVIFFVLFLCCCRTISFLFFFSFVFFLFVFLFFLCFFLFCRTIRIVTHVS
jgi:hypothetical protein